MHTYPPDSSLLKFSNYNTLFALKSKDEPFSYAAKLKGFNKQLLAQAKFKYIAPKFQLINSFSNDSTYDLFTSYKIDENIKIFLHSPNLVDFLAQFQTGLRLTLEKQYKFYIECSKTQKQTDFQFFATRASTYEDWKLKTILQLSLKNKQLQFSQFCQYAQRLDKTIKFTFQQNESSIMIESPYKQNTKLAFQIKRLYRLNKYNTQLNFGLKHSINDKMNLIAKLNQGGLGLIGIEGNYQSVKYSISNICQLQGNAELNFPFQFKIQVDA